jgi:uncharacterized membrane protein
VIYICAQFLIYAFSLKGPTELFTMVLNVGLAAILLVLGIDNPTATKFIKDIGEVMLEYGQSPTMQIQKINSIWAKLAVVWVAVSEQVAKQQKEADQQKESSPAPTPKTIVQNVTSTINAAEKTFEQIVNTLKPEEKKP